MIVRHLDELSGTAREVSGDTWTSRRLLLADDRLGFSLHDTVIQANTRTPMTYKHHLEAVYCLAGHGAVELAATGERFELRPGSVYALDRHDDHVLHADTEMRFVCVFAPPLVGPEVHGDDGAYPLLHADPYRSRTGAPWEIAPRVDPVRWGDDDGGALSPTQLATFERDGFLVLDRLLDEDTVSALRLDLDRAIAAADSRAADVVTEPESHVVRSLFDVHRARPPFTALAADARLVARARQLLGGGVYVHQSRVNLKPGLDGREFQWHSDFETWHVEDGMPRPRAVTAAVMLTASTPTNGPLLLAPGSHHHYVRCPGVTPEAHFRSSLRAQRYGTPPREALARLAGDGGIVQAIGQPGSVVLFDANTLHASGGNMAPSPRVSAFVVYNSVANRLVAPFGGQPPRPRFLAERDPVL